MDPMVGREDEFFGTYSGQEIPPAHMRYVSARLPYDMEYYYQSHGSRPDASWDRFEEIALALEE